MRGVCMSEKDMKTSALKIKTRLRHNILKTIEADANSITYTPPSTQDLFKKMMLKYRET